MQVMGEEKVGNVFASVEMTFEEKKMLMAAYQNITCYDMHDGKMIYLLTQHALFNCTHHPFLLCKCRHGANVTNPNHECILLTQEEQVTHYN
jgi:hypothetical protein